MPTVGFDTVIDAIWRMTDEPRETDMSIADSTREGATDPLSSDIESTRHTIRQEVDDAKRRASNLGEAAGKEAHRLGDSLKAKAHHEAEKRKNETATHIDHFAEAVRHASDELAERDQSIVSRLVQEAAGSIESVARSIRTHSVDDMARSVSRFGLERPTAFLAGAVIAGIAIGRFAKASAERQRQRDLDSESDFEGGLPVARPLADRPAMGDDDAQR
ncbi:hypothetical protein [Pararhizobium haloflavum]|uniref:hypothetical protein n=1 Tax=Pararhizobium haloflavum TaxID=2037914 RepID=UPI000C17F35C|nr:hypothetical protein [Pararhizobium haloflavum]